MATEIREILTYLRRHGYTLIKTHGNHWQVYDGTVLVTTIPGSPSTRRTWRIVNTSIRRHQRKETQHGRD